MARMEGGQVSHIKQDWGRRGGHTMGDCYKLGSKGKVWIGILRALRTTSTQRLHCLDLTRFLVLSGWYLP